MRRFFSFKPKVGGRFHHRVLGPSPWFFRAGRGLASVWRACGPSCSGSLKAFLGEIACTRKLFFLGGVYTAWLLSNPDEIPDLVRLFFVAKSTGVYLSQRTSQKKKPSVPKKAATNRQCEVPRCVRPPKACVGGIVAPHLHLGDESARGARKTNEAPNVQADGHRC